MPDWSGGVAVPAREWSAKARNHGSRNEVSSEAGDERPLLPVAVKK